VIIINYYWLLKFLHLNSEKQQNKIDMKKEQLQIVANIVVLVLIS